MWVIAAVASLGIGVAERASLALPPPGELALTLAALWLVAGVFITGGFAVGTLVRSSLGAVAICVGWILGVEALVVGMLAGVSPAIAAIAGYGPAGALDEFVTSPSPVGPTLVLIGWAILSAAAVITVFGRRDLA